jgi:pilus assembly protein FimV
MATLLDNPLVLPGAGVLVALLAGLGVYRLRSKVRKDSGETSFLESRLQPDSFFGASGGQRIDTRDAAGASSSMSYSLSQLDAIGDVDPVAEADVYLAYGRDLQAEEILKEAMRSNPDRLAIRTKLLEVYAKRRDTKGYELLATQLYGLTRGEGEEWHKAQEMGSHIDPENPLYRPGGRPAVIAAGGTLPSEPLGASTMPQSVMPATATSFVTTEPADEDRGPLSGLDLDLDLDQVEEPMLSGTAAMENTQPMPEPVKAVDFDVPTPTVSAPAQEAAVEFDFGALSLDLEPPAAPAQGRAAGQEMPDLGGVGLATAELEPEPGSADPLMRKLELAEEFRQIGDMEGARDLLEEVIAKASGPLKSRAQGLLTSLA